MPENGSKVAKLEALGRFLFRKTIHNTVATHQCNYIWCHQIYPFYMHPTTSEEVITCDMSRAETLLSSMIMLASYISCNFVSSIFCIPTDCYFTKES